MCSVQLDDRSYQVGRTSSVITTSDSDVINFSSNLLTNDWIGSSVDGVDMFIRGKEDDENNLFQITTGTRGWKQKKRVLTYSVLSGGLSNSFHHLGRVVPYIVDKNTGELEPFFEVYSPQVAYDIVRNVLTMSFWTNTLGNMSSGYPLDSNEVYEMTSTRIESDEARNANRVFCIAFGFLQKGYISGGLAGFPFYNVDRYELIPIFNQPYVVDTPVVSFGGIVPDEKHRGPVIDIIPPSEPSLWVVTTAADDGYYARRADTNGDPSGEAVFFRDLSYLEYQ